MPDRLHVWVVESGCYSGRGIIGVYESAEAARAVCPGWKGDDNWWDNGQDFDSNISAWRFPVLTQGEACVMAAEGMEVE